jgi:hypothetical protein
MCRNGANAAQAPGSGRERPDPVLEGYTVRIARTRPHLWRLGLVLDNLVLVQDSHPGPPGRETQSVPRPSS